MEELRALFGDFLGRARTSVVNLDDPEARALAGADAFTFSLADGQADYKACDIVEAPTATAFGVAERRSGETARVGLPVPGRHNVANALAAIAAARAAGVPLAAAAEALSGFAGLRRRFDVVGSRAGVTVIDDFGHNPDKIAATLATCHAFPGRLLLFFQPHGYGPLKTMRNELVAAFVRGMADEDVLILCDPVYYGGTVERAVTSADIVADVGASGRLAEHVPERAEAGLRLAALARPGDRILVMGARDDTLSQFAAEILNSLPIGRGEEIPA
jgi:UDP-N-acetylmuramate--alanine ligase